MAHKEHVAICEEYTGTPMNRRALIHLLIIALSFFLFNAFSQTYRDDTIAVRAILDSNRLFEIPVDSVADSGNGRITELNLQCKGLNTLSPEIGRLNALKKLVLYENDLKVIPPEIGNLITLTILILDKTKLKSLPPEIGKCISLELLNLDANALTNLPPEIGNLKRLKNISSNGNVFPQVKH